MSGVKKIDYEKPSPYLDTGPCVSHNAQRSVKKLVRTVPPVWCQKPVRNPHTFNPKDQSFSERNQPGSVHFLRRPQESSC